MNLMIEWKKLENGQVVHQETRQARDPVCDTPQGRMAKYKRKGKEGNT